MTTTYSDVIAANIWEAVSRHGHDGLELEFRLGHVLPGGHFHTDVGNEAWTRLRTALDASGVWTDIRGIETVDELMPDGRKLVTTVAVQTAAAGAVAPPPPHWLTKTVVTKIDVTPTNTSTPFTARASIATEEFVPAAVDAATPNTSQYRRHKVRRRYVWRCWAIDLTRVRSTLPDQLDADAESFEVEIELLDTGMLFERTMSSLAEWGLALVDDMVGLIGGS